MYAKISSIKTLKNGRPVRYQCQCCDEVFNITVGDPTCPYCSSTGRNNLIVLYIEDDVERAEWLELIDFSAG
jgi:hypothetical protein